MRTIWHQSSFTTLVTSLNPLEGIFFQAEYHGRFQWLYWGQPAHHLGFGSGPLQIPREERRNKGNLEWLFHLPISPMSGNRWISTFLIHRVVSTVLCFRSLDGLRGMCLVCKISEALCSSLYPPGIWVHENNRNIIPSSSPWRFLSLTGRFLLHSRGNGKIYFTKSTKVLLEN